MKMSLKACFLIKCLHRRCFSVFYKLSFVLMLCSVIPFTAVFKGSIVPQTDEASSDERRSVASNKWKSSCHDSTYGSLFNYFFICSINICIYFAQACVAVLFVPGVVRRLGQFACLKCCINTVWLITSHNQPNNLHRCTLCLVISVWSCQRMHHWAFYLSDNMEL